VLTDDVLAVLCSPHAVSAVDAAGIHGSSSSVANTSSAGAEMGDRLATTDMGRGSASVNRESGGGCCALVCGAGSHDLTQCGLGQGPPPYQMSSSSIQPFGHNGHGPKIGEGLRPLFAEGELVPCLTVLAYLRTKWHLDPCNRLATRHQRYRQTDKTDDGPIA